MADTATTTTSSVANTAAEAELDHAALTSDGKYVAALNLESLAIDETKEEVNNFLVEPDDSNIESVLSLSFEYSVAC